MLYDWLRAFHLIAVVCWMAGLLYLPRLFVYHADAKPGSEASETFKLMEKRLLTWIMNPALVATYVFGLLLLHEKPELMHLPYMQIKFALVLILTDVHYMLAYYRREFAADKNRHTARFYRILNEVPTILMIGIVIMVVVKPLFA